MNHSSPVGMQLPVQTPIFQREKLCIFGKIIDIYQPIPPMYGLCNGCTGQYGVIFWEQLRPGTLQEI